MRAVLAVESAARTAFRIVFMSLVFLSCSYCTDSPRSFVTLRSARHDALAAVNRPDAHSRACLRRVYSAHPPCFLERVPGSLERLQTPLATLCSQSKARKDVYSRKNWFAELAA